MPIRCDHCQSPVNPTKAARRWAAKHRAKPSATVGLCACGAVINFRWAELKQLEEERILRQKYADQ